MVAQKTPPIPTPKLDGIPLIEDGALVNLQTALGTSKDPLTHNQVTTGRDLTADHLTIEAMLRWHWGARRYVRERPREALRKWIEIDVEGGRETAGKDILDRLKVLRAKPVFRQALEFQRAYGGAAIIVLSGDSEGAKEPLNKEALGEGDRGIRGLVAVSSRRLQPDEGSKVKDVFDPDHGMPERWLLQPPAGVGQVPIHRSRILLWLGDYGAEREQPYEWGRSELEAFIDPWLEYLSVQGSGAGVAHRLAEQRMKIQGLMNLLANGKVEEAKRVIQEYATARSLYRMSVMDANDTVEDSSVTITGWEKIHEAAKEQVAAAAGMSVGRFFGTVRQGLSDSDESAAERDDAVIAEYQEQMIRPQLERLIELVAAEQGLPEDSWTLRFRPLREETPRQRAERRKLESETAQAYQNMNAVDSNEIREGLRNDPDQPYPLEEGPLDEPDEDLEAEVERLRALAQGGGQPAPSAPGDPEPEDE